MLRRSSVKDETSPRHGKTQAFLPSPKALSNYLITLNSKQKGKSKMTKLVNQFDNSCCFCTSTCMPGVGKKSLVEEPYWNK